MTNSDLTLPLAAFLILYGMFIFVYLLYGFFNIYHLAKFGLIGRATRAIIFIQAAISLSFLLASLYLVTFQDWSGSWNLSQIFRSSSENIIPGL